MALMAPVRALDAEAEEAVALKIPLQALCGQVCTAERDSSFIASFYRLLVSAILRVAGFADDGAFVDLQTRVDELYQGRSICGTAQVIFYGHKGIVAYVCAGRIAKGDMHLPFAAARTCIRKIKYIISDIAKICDGFPARRAIDPARVFF